MSRAYVNYAQNITFTAQSQAIPGRETEMMPNNAGGVGFVLNDWERLNRFLILGSEGGTYYVQEQKFTAENAQAAIRCIKTDGQRVVALAHDINIRNRAPKVDSQLFAMALCLKHGDLAAKHAAAKTLPSMLRIGTHVLHFAAMLDGLGGWSRLKRRVIANWLTQDADRLAFQVLKYQSRDGWSMRDLLRIAHPIAPSAAHKALYNWICGRDPGEAVPQLIADYRNIIDPLKAIECGIPREALPSEALANRLVWRALLPQTPPHALLRNLGVLTANETLSLASPDTAKVVTKLTDRGALRKARVHPFAILLATLVYRQGRGRLGSKTWTPMPAILSALEDAYDAAFDSLTPTGKRILIAVDVSGSMSGARCVGTPVAASTAAAAMALTLARSEPNAIVVRFDTQVRDIMPVTKRTGIASLERATGGGTICAAPIEWALSQSQVFDAFVLLTDSESWAGNRHACEAFEQYRRIRNANLKMVCCAMAANHANIIDPQDPRQLGACGLDTNLPSVIGDFLSR